MFDFIKKLRMMFEARKEYRRTVDELSSLSDAELNDIGINRTMIHSVALEANKNLNGWA